MPAGLVKVQHPLLNGQIMPGEADVFSFAGKKGETVVLEVFARRLQSSMDSLVKLLDESGKVIAWNDDGPWPNIGLQTHHSDSLLIHLLPADGTYCAHVSDAQQKGGKDVRCHLRIDQGRPDFAVFMDPSTVNAPPGSHAPVVFHVFRKEGFGGPIRLSIKSGPEGMTLSGTDIPAGVSKMRATIAVPSKLKKGPHPFVLRWSRGRGV